MTQLHSIYPNFKTTQDMLNNALELNFVYVIFCFDFMFLQYSRKPDIILILWTPFGIVFKAWSVWDKVSKNGLSKICGREPLKILKGYGVLKQTISLQIF